LKLNKSKTYILYYIGKYIPIKFLDKLNNTYIFFNNEYKICLRYTYSGKLEFTKYEKELESNEYYESTIDITKSEVLYTFNVPLELLDVLDLFISGKYSYLPEQEELVDFLICNFGLTEESKIIRIIRRDNELREALEEELNTKIPKDLDLSSLPDLDNENFIQEKIK
jgi:hypothetical protein